MASLFDLTRSNLSYYTIPAAIFILLIPHTYANVAAGRNYDVANPRKTEDHVLRDTTLPKETVRRIVRAKAATANALETVGVYAAAVVAGNVARLETRSLNLLTLGYIASRVVYNYVYVVAQDNSRTAPFRSLSWFTGIGLITTLFVMAGNRS